MTTIESRRGEGVNTYNVLTAELQQMGWLPSAEKGES